MSALRGRYAGPVTYALRRPARLRQRSRPIAERAPRAQSPSACAGAAPGLSRPQPALGRPQGSVDPEVFAELCHVAGRLDVVQGVLDPAVLVDDERGADHAGD